MRISFSAKKSRKLSKSSSNCKWRKKSLYFFSIHSHGKRLLFYSIYKIYIYNIYIFICASQNREKPHIAHFTIMVKKEKTATTREINNTAASNHGSASNKKANKEGYELVMVEPGAEMAGDQAKNLEDDKDITYLPPDGGWGWFVLAAAIIVNVLIPGGIKSFGVLYANFIKVFEASNAAGSWIPALCYFLYSSLGPLSSILSVKYSYRTVTLIGGTFAAVGMMASYFTTSVLYLCISYGVMVGIGAGLAFPPTVYIVNSYFFRLKGLANGLCISGSSLGSIILPRFMSYLLDTYSFRGTVLIMGGITLNVWACGFLYEPVEKHLVPVRTPKVEPAPKSNTEIEVEVTSSENTPLREFPDDEKSMHLSSSQSASNMALQDFRSQQQQQLPTSAAQYRFRKISVPVTGNKMYFPSQQTTTSQMHSTPTLLAISEKNNLRTKKNSQAVPFTASTSSFNYISTPFHGSTLSTMDPQFASTITLNAISSAFRKTPERKHDQQLTRTTKPAQRSEKDSKSVNSIKFFDLQLLRDPIYLVILISNCTNAISYTNFVIVLQLYVDSLGFDWDKGLMLTVISAFDLAGRIGGAALSDTQLMPKHFYFVGGLLISGISLTVLPLANTYLYIAVSCAIFGLASGVYVGVTAVVMADMLGDDKLTSSYGISLFVNGVIQLVGPPIVGQTYEHIKSYGPIFSSLGIVLIAGAMLWGIVPFIKRNKV